MNYKDEVRKALKEFWGIRNTQFLKQRSGKVKDAGSRSAVTGGKQMSGFEALAIKIAMKAGLPRESIFAVKSPELPGYFRAEKKWDLLVVHNKKLIAALEFKSQIGPSFGNNFNNRTEEAIGTATDLWTAFREGAFGKQNRPWLGYLFVLEDCGASNSAVKVKEPHFNVFKEFKQASYAKRYEIMLTKMILERHYDAASLILSASKSTTYKEPANNLTTENFFEQFYSAVKAARNNKVR